MKYFTCIKQIIVYICFGFSVVYRFSFSCKRSALAKAIVDGYLYDVHIVKVKG